MKLYTDNRGTWVGTQADTKNKKYSFEQTDVPTDKPNLLEFLNKMQVSETPGETVLPEKKEKPAAKVPIPKWKQEWLNKMDAQALETKVEIQIEEFLYELPLDEIHNFAAIIISRICHETKHLKIVTGVQDGPTKKKSRK
mgnify:CR=1 FL=1